MLSRLRISSHCPAKFSAIANAFGSASIRFTCASSTAGALQPSALGQRQQLLVRHRVPQEVAQPRGQLDVRDPVHPGRVGRVRDRARCGTGNAARPASPGSRGRCPARRTARRPSPASTNRFRAATSVRSPAGGTRGAPASRGSGPRRRIRCFGSQTRIRLRLGFSPFEANGPMTVTEPIHLFSLSL